MKDTKVDSFERYMTVADICNYLSVTDETVYRWIKNNELPAHRVGKRWMFQRTEIDAWVKSGKAAE
jgi:excisionase family DNA binding protein